MWCMMAGASRWSPCGVVVAAGGDGGDICSPAAVVHGDHWSPGFPAPLHSDHTLSPPSGVLLCLLLKDHPSLSCSLIEGKDGEGYRRFTHA